jgi:fido (protein-threonine AMPylation protein)
MIEPHAPDDHATPLAPGERDGLIPTHVTLKSELNELEQQNIATADIWTLSRRHYIFRERFLKSLHRRMFNRVWRWAGTFRTTERDLGVKSYLIETELRKAIDDARYWVENKTYPPRAGRPVSPSLGLRASLPQRQWTLVTAGGGHARYAAWRRAFHMG